MHAEFNALRAQVAINDGNPEEAERLAKQALEELPPAGSTVALSQPLYLAKCCTVKVNLPARWRLCSKPSKWRASMMSGTTPCGV